MYSLIGIILTVVSVIELNKNRTYGKMLFYIFSAALTFILCFRYGQGTDYQGYEYHFNSISDNASLWINELYHGELGWYMLNFIIKNLGGNFQDFIAIISFVMMFYTVRAISKYSPYKFLSLLILYPTFYLTYYFSALRQGIVIAVFLGIGIGLLLEKKYKWYWLMTICLIFIHSSAVILLFAPLVIKWRERKPEKWIVVLFMISVFLGYSGALDAFAKMIGISGYLEVNISYLAILLRAILFFIVYKLHKYTINYKKNEMLDVLYALYLFGFYIFILLAFTSTLSQRLTVPLKALEILLIPLLLYRVYLMKKDGWISNKRLSVIKFGKYRLQVFVLIIIVILNAEMIKNIDSYIVQGNYYDSVNVFNYPYISIFDKDEIYKYRSY